MDEIEIETKLEYSNGYSWDKIKKEYEEAIDNYLHELNQGWENEDKIIVRISQIETRILNIKGVLDISNTTIQGVATNYVLDRDSIVTRKENTKT